MHLQYKVTSRRHAWLLLCPLLLNACKTIQDTPSSTPYSDETLAALRKVCKEITTKTDSQQQISEACHCLDEKRTNPRLESLINRFCGGRAQSYYDLLLAAGATEGQRVITDSAGSSPSNSDLKCLDTLNRSRAEWALDGSLQACRANNNDAIVNAIDLPDSEPPNHCWRQIKMTSDGCIVAAPCLGRGGADVAFLPITLKSLDAWGNRRIVKEGGQVVLCHGAMQEIHGLKDPTLQNINYNFAFANYLGYGRSNLHETYGPANCHGAAQAIAAGNFLKNLPVLDLYYRNGNIKKACQSQSEAMFARSIERARELGLENPTGDLLQTKRGGYIVNMVYRSTCSRQDCGKSSVWIQDCTHGKFEAYVQTMDMCVKCWGSLLESAGLPHLPDQATWRDLKPGCVMTAADHSITITQVNDGLCYYYESLSPFAPAQLSIGDCPTLFSRFPDRWCPAASLEFDLMPPSHP